MGLKTEDQRSILDQKLTAPSKGAPAPRQPAIRTAACPVLQLLPDHEPHQELRPLFLRARGVGMTIAISGKYQRRR